MIHKKQLYLALRLQTLGTIKITSINPDTIQGFCSAKALDKLSVLCLSRGYFIQYWQSHSNSKTIDFSINLLPTELPF